ncbi:HesA/MoeB/ThiF family protein [Kitasatospora sp. NPDC088548]|uniref:HesA/MoeB/ThiF family protein n=1 Tax=Kitasatospora sp. NPDC088548 TaxID=3364075 RepID=UPI00381C327B
MNHPRLRTEHQPTRRPDGRIQIGSLPGLASILPDPDGWRWDLLQLLDGTLTTAEIVQTVTTEHPSVPAARIERLLSDLGRAGHLQFAVHGRPPARVASATAKRHPRTVEYWEMVDTSPDRTGWDIQRLLAGAVVTVVGVGGVGAAAAATLAGAGIGRLVLVDPDHVEEANLSRQLLYTQSDIDRPKVDAARERLLERNPQLDVVTRPERIASQPQFVSLMQDCNLLIVAADEPDGLRLTANRAALDTSCPWVDAGYHGPVISTALYLPGTGRPCWECLRHADATAYGLPGLNGDALPAALPRPLGNPVTAASAGIAGNYAAQAALTHLTGTRGGFPPATIQRHSLIAPADQQPAAITHPRNPDCLSCARHPVQTP